MSDIEISVACCTYNGESYILEQLQSMARQTRLPDEVIICDDGSSDSTIAIVKSFAKVAPFPIILFENEGKPLRSTKNFEKAIRACCGEVIFLSDQDDVWLPTKVELLTKAIEQGAGMAFSNAALVNEDLNPLGYSLFDSLEFSTRERTSISENRLIDILVHRNIVTGAGVAFSSKHLSLILPISQNWVHDGWIAFLISTIDNVVILNDELYLYRQHSKNQIGSKKLSMNDKFKLVQSRGNQYYSDLLNGFKDLRLRLTSLPKTSNVSFLNIIDNKIQHIQIRTCVVHPKFRFIFTLLNELFKGNYHRYSMNWITFFRDVVMLVINLINKYKFKQN